ncbi:MAG TPA: hypothetical protein VGB77_08130 [Abditibacteriaceae bacterium]|jgi:hypothetical protein
MQCTKNIVVFSILLLTGANLTQPSKAAVGKYSRAPVYQQRVKVISDELKPQIAALWQLFGKLEAQTTTMQKRAVRDGRASAADKDEWNRLKTSLSSLLQNLRANTKRLRSVSPVPKSLKKIDAKFVDASFELEEGFDSLVVWTNTPSSEMKLQLGRQLRKGINSWTNALIALNRVTDNGVKAKVYTPD